MKNIQIFVQDEMHNCKSYFVSIPQVIKGLLMSFNDSSEFNLMGNTDSSSLPQIDGAYDLGKGYDPVRELMRAIILRTVDDYNSVGEDHDEAVAYMMDESDEYIFSFAGICKHMGLDPQKTRDCIMYTSRKISTRRRSV